MTGAFFDAMLFYIAIIQIVMICIDKINIFINTK